MIYLTLKELNEVVDVVNGFDVTYGDILDNTNREYEIVEEDL